MENNSIKVWVQEVAGSGNYHTSVKIEPENQEKYANDKRFQNVDENGRRYATIGAGPDGSTFALGNLVSGETSSGNLDGINRARDVSLSNKVWESQTLVPASIEDAYISKLFEANANYKSNLDYAFFPIKLSDSYNSNSYTAGLLHATGITPPTLPTITTQTQWQDLEYPERSGSINLQYTLPQFQTPGYDKPVPIEYFGGKK